MSTYAYWRHGLSDDFSAATMHAWRIARASGPLNELDMTAARPRHLPNGSVLASWVSRSRHRFEPVGPCPTAPRDTEGPSHVLEALVDGRACLGCIARASHMPSPEVADVVARLANEADIVIADGRCRDCRQHRSLVKLLF